MRYGTECRRPAPGKWTTGPATGRLAGSASARIPDRLHDRGAIGPRVGRRGFSAAVVIAGITPTMCPGVAHQPPVGHLSRSKSTSSLSVRPLRSDGPVSALFLEGFVAQQLGVGLLGRQAEELCDRLGGVHCARRPVELS